ncbi:DUF6455 family protein [Pararhodobacter zhoushanensis]|uniref:DUF6455 family protein n=1 Tax=Pararhodobacter zhoushanensis TaxID=2479545 RepID=A0ABT3GYI5_9RHOB|nr:DUF6455 family protein [Pararhodobacter zhoushanensis]MCW1932587.1 DUF6455 family protein [Pararhodobacter zhoushanensis]
MGLFSKIDQHADLMNRMATTVHADLDEAIIRADLSAQELRNAIFTCIGCTGVCDCESWLEAHADGADETPAYCRNGALLQRLQRPL